MSRVTGANRETGASFFTAREDEVEEEAQSLNNVDPAEGDFEQ